MSVVSRILVLGEVGSGKSAFVHCASAVAAASRSGRPVPPTAGVTFEALSKSPTVGIDVTEIQYAAAKFVLTEIGGSMAPIWPRYFEDCDCILFVVDACDASIVSNMCELAFSNHEPLCTHEQLRMLLHRDPATCSLVHLARITSHPCTAGKPIVIAFSKTDAPCSIPRSDLSNFLRLNDYKRLLSPPLETADVSCVTLSGVDALLQMLLRLCQATGVVPVKSARSTTDRR